MNNTELIKILDELEYCIDNDIRKDFENSTVYPIFKKLLNIILWDDGSLNKEVISKLDILTDNVDSLDFNVTKNNIHEIKDLIK